MLHLTTEPTWTPSGLIDANSAATNTIGIVLLVALVAGVIWMSLATRGNKFRKHAVGALVLIVIAVVGGGSGAAFMALSNDHIETAHRSEITKWLSTAYGAQTNAHDIDGRGYGSVYEVSATIDGRTAIIKLARTPDDHIAVFGTDDKPLPKRP